MMHIIGSYPELTGDNILYIFIMYQDLALWIINID